MSSRIDFSELISTKSEINKSEFLINQKYNNNDI